MNKYLYDNIEFTQDEIQIAADNAKLSFDDYLLEHPEIESLDISGPGDPEKKKKKKKDEFVVAPTDDTLDKLLGEFVPDYSFNSTPTVKTNSGDFNQKFLESIQPVSDTYSDLNKDIKLEEKVDETAKNALDKILDFKGTTIQQRKVLRNTEKALNNIQGYKLNAGKDEVLDNDYASKFINDATTGQAFVGNAGFKWLVKTAKNGEKTYYKLEDIINENNNFNLLESLEDADLDLDTLIDALGEGYELYDNTEGTVLDEAVVMPQSVRWKEEQFKNRSWGQYFDNAINPQVLNDEEGEAQYTLRNLLPEEFKIEETSFGRDRLKITGPSGKEFILQVDLSLVKPKDQRLAALEIYDLKQFVASEQFSKDNIDGWKWSVWNNRINQVQEKYQNLINTPVTDGGIGLSEDQIKIGEDLFNYETLTESLYRIGTPMSSLAEDNYGLLGEDVTSNAFKFDLLFKATEQINLSRKSQGLMPISTDFNLEDLRRYVAMNAEMIENEDGTISFTEDEGYSYSSQENLHGYGTEFPKISVTEFNEIINLAVELGRDRIHSDEIEKNVEEYAEQNLWHGGFFASDQKDKRMGFGTAGSQISQGDSNYLFQVAEIQANVAKNELNKKIELWENLPNKDVVTNFTNNNTFANYNNSSPTAVALSTFNISIIPEVDSNGNALVDTYVKIRNDKDDEGNELLYLVKKGEPLFGKGGYGSTTGGPIIFDGSKGYVNENGEPVAMMPITSINQYNVVRSQAILAQKSVYDRIEELTDYITDLPNFADQVAAWDKNYNELENFGVTLGISGLSLAKNLVVGAAALTMYINPMYWGGQMVGLDAFEAMSDFNVYIQTMLDQEKESYNFSQVNFNDASSIAEYIEWTSNMFADTLPIMAVMILSGGSSSYAAAISSSIAGLSGAGSAITEIDMENARLDKEINNIKNSDKLDEEAKKIEINELESKKVKSGSASYMADAAFGFGNEFVFSYLTTAQWGKSMNKLIFEAGEATTKKLYNNLGQRIMAGGKSWLKEGNTEGLGELGVTFFDNLYNGRPLSEGLLEAYAGGFAITGILDGAGKGYSGMSKVNYASNKEINSLTETQEGLLRNHKLLDEINAKLKGGDIKSIYDINKLKVQKLNVEEDIMFQMGEMETKVEAYNTKLKADGMRLSAANMYTNNQRKMSELRVKALNLAADPEAGKVGTEANKELKEINKKYKNLENLNQLFLDKDNFGHEWFARRAEGLDNKEVRAENNKIETEAVKRIKEKLKKPDYIPDQTEIDAEAVKIVDEQVYEKNNAKAAIIAEQGGWNYNNNSNNAEGVAAVEVAYDEAIANADPNETIQVKTEAGATITMKTVDWLESKKQNAIKGIKDGSINGFFDEDINTQFNFKENAVKNQKVGVPLHEGAHGATKKLIKSDPEGFKQSANILVEFLKTQQPEVWVNMQLEGTNGLRAADGTWDFEEVFSSFVEEVAAGRIDLDAHRDFTAFFGMELNKGFKKASDGKYRVDFKGTNDINNFLVSLGKEIGMGEVSAETLAELEARAEDQGAEVIDINRDQQQVDQQQKAAASETKMSKTGPTKAELVAENKKLLKDKPEGFRDKIARNVKIIKEKFSAAASAPSSTLGVRGNEPASSLAQRAKKVIDGAVDKVRSKIPAWKKGNRQKPNPVMDKLHSSLDKELDAMIKAKAERFLTNDKNIIDLTQNVDLKELQQAVKLELLADFRGFNKNNDSLYGYINGRLKQRIGDVLPELWTDMSQKDIDNLSTKDTKNINETKPLVESVPDVNLRESLEIDRDSPLGDYVTETVEKVLSTKMPEFKYVRKNKGGKRTNVSLAEVKKVLETNPTGETKRQAERDLAGIYKKFTNDLENRFAEELRDAFVETFGSRADYTNWLDINADAISDLSIEKLVAFERLVKGEKIFTEVVKENLSVEEVKQLEGTGLLVSATTNQGPTLYKKLNPTKQQVIDFFDIKGSKKGTRKDALADKISGELALNATMEIAGKPEVMEKFELGLENSGTGEIVTKAYLEDISKAIGRGVDLKFSKSFDGSSASIELKNTYKNNRQTFVDLLAKTGITDENVDIAWEEVFGDTDFNLKKNAKYKKLLLKEWKGLSKQIADVESILSSEIQMDILNSVIDDNVDVTDTERAKLIADARKQKLTSSKEVDFDDILTNLAKNLGLTKGYAYEQLVYDSTQRAIEKYNATHSKDSALKIEGVRGEDGGKADFIATIGGNAFNVELKLNNARFGSVGVISNTNANGNITFDLTKDYSFNKNLLEMVYSANPDVKAWVNKANEVGKEKYGDLWVKYDFGDIIDKEVFKVLQDEGFQSRLQRKIVLPADSVGEGYASKNNGTAYMNISKIGDFKGERRGGLYKLRNTIDSSLEDPANLGESVPYLDGEATWSLAIGKTTAYSAKGPQKYQKAGVNLVNGKLPGSSGWANVNLRIQVTKLDGLPESKIDMSTEAGITQLQNLPAVQNLDIEKGKSSEVNIKNNSSSQVVTAPPMSQTTNNESLRQAAILDRALDVARDPNAPVKKIRVFDFDDTLARTNSNVLYTMPDGTTGKLTAEEFAKKGDEMQADGAVWDFSEFNKVVDGKKGPLFRVAQKIAEARGTDDVFVLTARAPEAAPAIKEFLDSIGLEIPIDNITGLGDSSPLAKSGWMVDKAAEGYNDFYFADDHLGNVDAVDKAMSVIDVKSKTQQAKMKFSKTVPEVMNDIIFDKTGIETYKEYSSMRAKAKGRRTRSFSLIASSAQDFGGLLYKMLAKGEKGNAQWEWMQENLIKPFSRGMNDLSIAQNQLMNDFRTLKKSIEGIPTNLKKKAFGGFTYEDITRIAAWDRQGINVEGLSKRDLKQIRDFVDGMPEIDLFVNQLIELTKGDGYHYPGGDWLAGTITTDFLGGLRSDTRPRVLKQWIENIDLAFDEKTLNKLEAAFGPKYREALEDSIRRMKTGQNRRQGISRLEARFQDYINNSVGAVMFLNARSAVLQTISAVNFVNWSDNNPLKAGKAFANQKQYWTDFMSLMNSDFLVDRRNGLRINVSESEIAEAAKTTGNSVKGVISFLLNKGFVLTQFADSFAIASGGATFYRNRVNTYIKQGMSKADAEAKAFLDFRDTAEESQQSARPDKISQQQAGTLGRFVLAFANTPSQYARIMDKAGRDLAAGRGDWKSNISKIMYYGFVQNLMFTALQSAMFASEDEDELDLQYFKDQGLSDKKADVAYKNYLESKENDYKTANSMLDNILRGIGVQGVIISTAKNTFLDLYERSKKEGQWPGPEYGESAWKLLEVSPPLSIKMKKYKGGMRDYEMNSWRPESKEIFNINNPSYRAMAKVVAAVTNVPVDRLFQKMENVKGALDATNEDWQRIAMLLGWPKWQLESDKQRLDRYSEEKEGRKKYRAEEKKKNTRQYFPKSLPTKEQYKAQELKKQSDTLFKLSKSEQIDSLRTLGLTTDAIKRLKYEQDRVNKIIELNK